LERAAQHVANTDAPVVRAALDAGYAAHESFTRAFRSMFCLSPSEFRRRGGLERSESPSGVHYAPDGRRVTYRSSWQGDKMMEVTIVEREPCRVAFVRNIGPHGEAGFAWQRLMAWAGPKRLLGPQT
jgi:AraC family transcriptional regulator